jgi:hypothetical protein
MEIRRNSRSRHRQEAESALRDQREYYERKQQETPSLKKWEAARHGKLNKRINRSRSQSHKKT